MAHMAVNPPPGESIQKVSIIDCYKAVYVVLYLLMGGVR